jgi:hypothetical protein
MTTPLPRAASDAPHLGLFIREHRGSLRRFGPVAVGAFLIILTLRRGYSPTGSRFIPPATAGGPRRRCPRHWMVLAAFSSRSRMRPQFVQIWVRTLRRFWMRSPHPLQSCEVYAGLTTPATVLRGIRWTHHFHSLPGARCLESADAQEVAPCSVVNRRIQARFRSGPVVQLPAVAIGDGRGAAAEGGRLNSFNVDGVVGMHQRARRLVVKVRTLSAHVLLLLLATLSSGFLPPVAALLAAGNPLLGFLQRARLCGGDAGSLPRRHPL